MRKLLFIFSILIISCTQTVEKPKNLVSEEKMIDILVEIYKYQSSSYMNETGGKPINFARLNTHILEKQGVNIEDFEKSYEYYVLSPDLYEPMLIEVRTKLENQLPEADRIKRENDRKAAEKQAEQ